MSRCLQGAMQRLKVKSEPLKQLVGEGRNEKYVRECTELHLGYQGKRVVDHIRVLQCDAR